MSFWTSKRVLVTGGAGFLGFYVVGKLRDTGWRQIFVPRSKEFEFDLRKSEAIVQLFEQTHPDMVVHLAAAVGRIGPTEDIPGSFFMTTPVWESRLWSMHVVSESGNLFALARSAPIPSLGTCRSRKRIFGTVIRRKQTHPMAWRRRCYWSRHSPTVSTGDARSLRMGVGRDCQYEQKQCRTGTEGHQSRFGSGDYYWPDLVGGRTCCCRKQQHRSGRSRASSQRERVR